MVPNRCAWPFPLFSITSGWDPFQHSLSLSFPLYQSVRCLSLHTSWARDQHHPSTCRETERKEKKEETLTFDALLWNVSDPIWGKKKWLKTSWNHSDSYTLTHTAAAAQVNVALIFGSFIQHKHPDKKTDTPDPHGLKWRFSNYVMILFYVFLTEMYNPYNPYQYVSL